MSRNHPRGWLYRGPLSGQLFRVTRWHHDHRGRVVIDRKVPVSEDEAQELEARDTTTEGET